MTWRASVHYGPWAEVADFGTALVIEPGRSHITLSKMNGTVSHMVRRFVPLKTRLVSACSQRLTGFSAGN